jgi:hypothetical protein
VSPEQTLYVAAVLVVATLVAMASGKFDPVLSLMVALIVAGMLGIAPPDKLLATRVSFTLINPYSHQTNLMIMRPGGYTTRSFAVFGIPVLVASLVAACIVAYVLMRA